ncbi:TlpA family protein disulfide reductase [Leucothrix sargassi]|nr:TlpA family protein disulfide reductase [Leucothrix sargassi]
MTPKHVMLFTKIVALTIFLNTAALAQMTDIYGNPNELNNYLGRGKWVVVKVWKSSCQVCMTTMRQTNSSQRVLPNTWVLGVSLDGDPRVAKQSLHRLRVNFKNLVSNLPEFNRYIKRSTKRNITGFPTYMIYDPKGKLKAMQTGSIKPAELRRYIIRQQAKARR